MSEDIAVRLQGVTKRFGSITAVREVSLDVRRGEFLASRSRARQGNSSTKKLPLARVGGRAGWERGLGGEGLAVRVHERRQASSDAGLNSHAVPPLGSTSWTGHPQPS